MKDFYEILALFISLLCVILFGNVVYEYFGHKNAILSGITVFVINVIYIYKNICVHFLNYILKLININLVIYALLFGIFVFFEQKPDSKALFESCFAQLCA